MAFKPREGGLVYTWFYPLLCTGVLALLLQSGHAPAAERPSLTLRAGPGEQYAIVATVPTASSMEITIFEEHQEWSRVRLSSGEEGWMRVGPRAQPAPAADPRLDRAPTPASLPVQPALPTAAPPAAPPSGQAVPLVATPAPARSPGASSTSPPPAAPPAAPPSGQAVSPVATPAPARSPGASSTSPVVLPAPSVADRPPAPEQPAAPLPAATTGPAAVPRTALVIGNAAYEREIGALANAGNDAEDVASTLRQLGFQVTLVRDAEYGQMDEALRAFHEQLRRHRGVGLFYYAGHGAELEGLGYLLPLHSGIRDRWQLPHKALNVKYIQAVMEEAGNRLNMIVLDACRDIPAFEGSDMQLRGRGLIPQRGLPVTTAGPDMLIAYATSPGKTALDGADTGRNGLYTKHLLRAMTLPGMSAEDVFRETRRGVLEETNGKQRPWESVSLTERFEFMPSPRRP